LYPESFPYHSVSIARVVDPGLYAGVDVRQHTETSLDCALTLAEAARAGACEGLDAAVVSDPVWRAPLGGAQQHTECRLLRSLRVSVPGVGRFSVFPIEEARGGMPDPDQGLGGTGGEVLSHLRQAFPQALIQVDRPLYPREGYLALNRIDPGRNLLDLQEVACGFDAVEVLSGRDVAGARLMLKAWFKMLNDGRKVIATGGSGSRTVTAEEGGGARTFVYCPRAAGSPTADEIARALTRLKEEPNAFVTNGPFVDVTLNGRPIGSTQQAPEGKAQMRLRVSAPGWIDVRRATIYRNGEVAQQLALEEPTKPLRCDRIVELDASRDCWFAVVVEGDRPMWPVYCGGADAPTPFAVTNSFWVDADGDGRVRPAG
jgi:hypothetical protein